MKSSFTTHLSFAVRGEDFHDYDGLRTGTPQTLRELTYSFTVKVGKHMYLRPEYRTDWSEASTFNAGASKSQSTWGIGAMMPW